jgi:ribosomal protein S6--L-glutamate ligase/gamma-F420-2:alpha-L-glutamate ligase
MNGLLIYRLQPLDKQQGFRLQTIIDAFKENGLMMIAVTTKDMTRLLETSNKGFFQFALLLDEDPQIARYLEGEHQLKVFNDENAINVCFDRALLSITLRNAMVPSPATIALPYVLNVNLMQVIQDVKFMMNDIAYPVLVKNRYPQPNEKIYYVRDENELVRVLAPIGMQPLIVQAFVPPTDRQSFKVLVIGEKTYAGVEVVTVEQTEYLKETNLPKSVSKIAIKAAKTIGADYALVSVFYLNKKNPYVYSVKSNPNIVELQVVTGLYLSAYLAQYIRKQLK